jgi:hypothetical protein
MVIGKIKLLTIKKDFFYKDKKLLNLYVSNLQNANYIQIVFESQKTEKKLWQCSFAGIPVATMVVQ